MDIPVKRQRREHKYPFSELEVGGMFFLPDRARNDFASYACLWGRKLKRSFVTRLTYCHPVGDGWKPCHKGDEGASLGIAVYRVADKPVVAA